MTPDRFYELAIHALARIGVKVDSFPTAYVKAALDTCREKVKLFTEVPNFTAFYFKDEIQYSAETIQEFGGEARNRLLRLRDAFAKLSSFDVSSLEASLKQAAADLGIKAGLLVHPLRMAATGSAIGPSLYHLMEVLGKDRVLARIDRAAQSSAA
jgi:glutamyl-tRNA synthetase